MAIFETCLTNNSSPIHQENIILCALTDPYKPENRCKAVEAIKFIRAELARKAEEAELAMQVEFPSVDKFIDIIDIKRVPIDFIYDCN